MFFVLTLIAHPFFVDLFRSVILRRKRTDSGHSLVSEGLREAITSYLQMTEGDEHSWDTWGKAFGLPELTTSNIQHEVLCCVCHSSTSKPEEEVLCMATWLWRTVWKQQGELRHYTALRSENCWQFFWTCKEIWADDGKYFSFLFFSFECFF